MTNNTNLAQSMGAIDATYQDLFKEITRIEDSSLSFRPNCKFCNHPIRIQGEQKWEESNFSFAPVERLFKKWEEENPSESRMYPQNIRTHLLKHYRSQEKKLWLEHYTEECKAYMNLKIAQDRRFDMLRAVAQKEMFEIAADPTLDRIKKSDQIVKLIKIVLEIDDMQNRLRGDIRPANVLMERFSNAWSFMIAKQHDEKVKAVLLETLDLFQEQMQSGISVED